MTQDLSGLVPQPAAAPEATAPAADTPAPVNDGQVSDAPGAPEQVEETDEQKNTRLIREREERSQRQLKGVQKRFDELTRDKYAERAARERAEREADELRKRLSGNAQSQASTDGPPKREDFADYDSWIEAKAEYKAAQIVERKLQEAERAAQERQAQEQLARQQQEGRRAIVQSAEKLRAQFKDFDEAMDNIVDVDAPPAMERAIAMSENPAAILYALGKQPEVARQIARLDPLAQAKAIGAIEFALKSRPPQVSQAPAPGAPVGGRPSSPPQTLETATNYDDWLKLRRKQIAARR